jgi:predicted metal-dependent phosphoesterase TrpH
VSHRLDHHIHSCYSFYDGLMSPRAVVKVASALGYDAVSVTDHFHTDRSIRGTFATQRLAREHGLIAYPGLEYSVRAGPDRGHVLVYVDDVSQVPRRGLTLAELLDHTAGHGLTVIHPHPFGLAGIRSLELMQRADFIELNGSYRHGRVNQLVRRVAQVHDLTHKLVAGSDAHARGQMGSAYTEVAELHASIADTLATKIDARLQPSKRRWGRVAKHTRLALAPFGLAMNGVQMLATGRALAKLGAAREGSVVGVPR